MDQMRPVTAAMIERLGVADAHDHLDVASGTGEPGLTVANLARSCRVVLTDLAPEMLAVASRRAAALGVTNIETVVCSADDLPFDDATFDTVTVRFGLMFFPDLAAATAEIARVLRPGGRVCASVWVDPEENPWTSVAMDAIAAEVPLPPSNPDRPSMFRCAAPGCVRDLYTAAGLSDVDEWDVGVELVTESPEQYWSMISEHMSLAVTALAKVDDAARTRIGDAALAAASRYEVGGLVRVPGKARCIVGTR
jgi:SAM-dependent methyltransferase